MAYKGVSVAVSWTDEKGEVRVSLFRNVSIFMHLDMISIHWVDTGFTINFAWDALPVLGLMPY